MTTAELAQIMPDVARRFWGEPNRRLSNRKELRWGSNGARSVDLEKGAWFDFEANEGGGVLDLLKREQVAEPWQWLREQGYADHTGRANGSSNRRHRIVAAYDYTDEIGTLLFQVCRYEPKNFKQRRKARADDVPDDVKDGWVWNVKGVRRVPYRLPELIKAVASHRRVFIVEGEKDCDTLARQGITATTNVGGAGKWNSGGKWNEALAEHFRGADVVLIPDNDDAGRNHVNEVGQSLIGIAARLRLLELPKLPDKGDVSDWFTQGGTVEKFSALADAAPDWSAEASPRPLLLRIDLARYDSEPIPAREWGVPDRFPRRAACLLSGEGGRGKSMILLQLAAAHVLGKDWLRSLPEFGPVVLVNAEDEEGEIVRRLKPIVEHYGASFADLARDLHIFSLAGADPLLALPDRSGRIVTTPLYAELMALVRAVKPVCTIIDNVADVFGASEIERSAVRQFLALMRQLAIAGNGYVVMSSHPSLTGLASKTGLSGSTQWHNAVRARAWLHGGEANNGEAPDPDLRVLEFLKSNYSRLAETITLRWQNGLYVPVLRQNFLDEAAANVAANDVFLNLIDRFTRIGQNISSNPAARNYAPTLFAREAEAKSKHLNKAALEAAMHRLFAAELITLEPYGPPSHEYRRIIRKTAA
jgi:RecA-family ATPase